MPDWMWSWWIFQWLGFVLMGGGLIAIGLSIAERARRARDRRAGATAGTGIPGNLPAGPGINIANVRIGGDIGGLVAVIGLFLAFAPSLWGVFLLAAIGGVLVAIGLFLWHRYHPW